MSDQSAPHQPVVPAHESPAEATVRAILIGVVLAVVLGAANVYLGLYAGMTVSASIPAAVVSMAILRGVLKSGTILENNIAQTIASTGESLAAGAIFTIPAMLLVGAWQDFEFWPTTIIIMLGGLLGVVFMVPLRRALIVDRPDLIYPEGVACSEVLIAGQEGGSGIKVIAAGLGLGALFKLMVSGFDLVRGTVEGAVAASGRAFYFGSDMSPALLAVGYIVRFQVAMQVFLGGVIGWIVAIPILGGLGGETALDGAWNIWSSEVRYMGVGAMLVGGLYSIWNVRAGIVAGIVSLGSVGSGDSLTEVPRTERDMSLPALTGLFGVAALGTFGLYRYLISDTGEAIISTVLMIAASFLFVAVATYIVGLVGSSNSPVSGMTICALLLTAAVLHLMGYDGPEAMLATLGVAGVVCCAACSSGDIAQDLKTGYLVGATPRVQQWCEVIGVLIPAFVFAPVMSLLHNRYGIGEGGELRAPQAELFANLTRAIFGDGNLPTRMVVIGAAVGVAIIVADAIARGGKSGIRLHIMPVAVGLYLPLALSVPIFIGGMLRYWVDRKRTESDVDNGVLFGSGLIAGEALMGIGLAVPAALSLTMPDITGDGPANIWFSLLLFAGLIAVFRRAAR